LPYSETFIAAQGKFLQKHMALFTGFDIDQTGKDMLAGSPCYVLEDYVGNIQLSKFLTRRGIINQSWLNDIQQHSPTVIHAHFLKDGLDALILKEELSIPLITTLHGHDISKTEKKSLFRKSRAYLFDRADKFIVVSDHIYNHAIQNGCPEEKIIKHFIGIDLDSFKSNRNEAETPELLFVGRLTEKKGGIYLLRAMSVLKDKYPELRLTIVGDGSLRKELQTYVETKQLNVDFVGRESSSQIRDRLSKTWVFVAPSITARSGDTEGLPITILEAQALKVPVVSFDSAGISQALEHGVTGLLSKEKDVSALIENIDYFLSSESERIAFGNNGRLRVEKLFDVRKQCKILDGIYDSVK
jgi:glycosyltransferase involved in cell wall biosynthesis